MEYEKTTIKKKIEESEIISFDVFDTLLLRNVCRPTDVFEIVENLYSNRYGEKIDFKKLRIEAEKKVRHKSKKEEVCFDEIYSFIYSKIGEKSRLLKKLELEVEKKIIVPNKFMLEMFNYAKELGKQIIIISDMYLSAKVIRNLLTENQYIGFKEIYVSCEVNKTKATGKIYNYIRDELGIKKNDKWIHIGDNYISDVVNANSNNVEGIYYKRVLERQKENCIKNLTDSLICAIKMNMEYEQSKEKYWEKFGIKNVSPIYIGLMLNLIEKLKDKDNIYFLSRDGWLPYKMYNLAKNSYKNLPEAKYIYASRRAYVYPSLYNNEDEAIELFLKTNSTFNEKVTIENIFKNLGLNIDNYTKLLKKYDFENVAINTGNIDTAKIILQEVWSDIRNNLIEEKSLVVKYLEQEKLLEYDVINIFDIGWAGSTQKALINLLNKNIEGYYFGTIETIDKTLKEKSYGYAFDKGLPIGRRNSVINNVMIYELLFTAPEGSLKRFKYDNTGKIIPELMNFQSNYMYECIEKFQSGAIKVLEKVLEYKEYIEELPSIEFSFDSIQRFIEEKNIVDLIQFEKIKNTVSIGESEDIKPYVTRFRIEEYLDNYRYDKKIIDYNLWKNAVIIEDDNGRIFNLNEFNKLYNLNRFEYFRYIKKLFYYIKKSILNPGKAVNRLICMIKFNLKQK